MGRDKLEAIKDMIREGPYGRGDVDMLLPFSSGCVDCLQYLVINCGSGTQQPFGDYAPKIGSWGSMVSNVPVLQHIFLVIVFQVRVKCQASPASWVDVRRMSTVKQKRVVLCVSEVQVVQALEA